MHPSLSLFGRNGRIQPFLPNRPSQNSWRSKKWNKFCPQTDATTFAFASLQVDTQSGVVFFKSLTYSLTQPLRIAVGGSVLGCSDLVLFFEFNHMAAFHEWDLLVLRPSLRGRAAKFSFSKNRRDLKNEYFFLKICRILPNTSKNNRQK